MHCNILVKIAFLTLVLLGFSASSCDVSPGVLSGSTDYETIARNDAINAGIPAQYFVNQIQIESHFNPYAKGASGEIGIAQFMPDTAAGLGIDPSNAEQSLQGAAQLMSRYVANYGDYKKALAAYNCGSYCLQSAIDACGYSWFWCWDMPASTRTYINEVMS